MFSAKWVCIVTVSAIVLASVNFFLNAQAGSYLQISGFMTAQEVRATGLSSLSAAQRAALDRWFTRYTEMVIKTARHESASTLDSSAERYATGSGHWIDKVSDNGAIITLEDGSMWDVSTIDQVDTALWLPVTDITVVADPHPIGEFRYVLVNTEDGEKAHAKYMGSH